MNKAVESDKAFTKTQCLNCKNLINISWPQYNTIVVTGSCYVVCGHCRTTSVCRNTPNLDTHKV